MSQYSPIANSYNVEICKQINSAYAFVRRPEDGHILMVREKARQYHKDINPACPLYVWSLPGGKLDDGEKPHLGVMRETEEETGLTVKADENDVLFKTERYNQEKDGLVHVQASVFACVVENGDLCVAGDPDKQVEWAGYMSPEDVLAHIGNNPDPAIHEALAQFITQGRAICDNWVYMQHNDPDNQCVLRRLISDQS